MSDEKIIPAEILKKFETRGRPKKFEDHIALMKHMSESKYHQNYYHATNKEIQCEHCGRKTTLRSYKQHMKSIFCLRIRDYKKCMEQ